MTEMSNFIAAFAKNQLKIKSSVDKEFWVETKSFLQYKAASLALKKGKTPVNWIFQSPRRRPPQGQNVHTFIRP
jgi:hypothetical protein